MGSGGKNSPDYGDLAVAQGEQGRQSIIDQTYANRPTQYTPWGYNQWTNEQVIDPATGKPTTRWTQTQGLTPELQDILNKQIAIMGGRSDIAGMLTGRLGNEFGQQVDWSGLSPMAATPAIQATLPEGSIGDPNQFRQQGSDAAYSAAMSRITPQYDEQRRAAEVRMMNQGLRPGDRAWDATMQGIGQSEADATQQAIWGSEEAGRRESQQMFDQLLGQNRNIFQQSLGSNQQNFGQALQAANYANALRQQQMSETMQQRGFGLNEINALLSGQQVNLPTMPQFNTAGAAPQAPIYQAGVDQGNYSAMTNPWSGIADIAGTIGGAAIGRWG